MTRRVPYERAASEGPLHCRPRAWRLGTGMLHLRFSNMAPPRGVHSRRGFERSLKDAACSASTTTET